MPDRPDVVDLFAGAGGFSEGFRQVGFEITLANEIHPDAASTYSLNHRETLLIQKDIKRLKASEIREGVGRPDIVIGGPPCQGFSAAGRKNPYDSRNTLILEYLRITKSLKPDAFLMENVTGLLYSNSGKTFASFIKSAKRYGYFVSYAIFDSSKFGVPQKRQRLFILGSRNKTASLKSLNGYSKVPTTVRQAIGDLEFLDVGHHSGIYHMSSRTKYQKLMRGDNHILYNHVSSSHTNKTKKMFSKLRPGETIKDLRFKFTGKKLFMCRLFPDAPCRTLTTNPDDYLHYSKDRSLTVREMARLQSFPDSYIFLGSRTTGGKYRRTDCPQYTQVGNAVPPLLARAIGVWIKNEVFL